MKKPPCYADGKDCERRYVACRADCEKWHEWLVIHEAEKEAIRKNKHDYNDVESFFGEQWQRDNRAYHADVMRNRRRKG